MRNTELSKKGVGHTLLAQKKKRHCHAGLTLNRSDLDKQSKDKKKKGGTLITKNWRTE